MILNQNAVENLSIVKPSINLSQTKIITALTTNKNKPKVTIVIGSVKNTKIGFKIAFKIPRNTATQKPVNKLSTVTPFK